MIKKCQYSLLQNLQGSLNTIFESLGRMTKGVFLNECTPKLSLEWGVGSSIGESTKAKLISWKILTWLSNHCSKIRQHKKKVSFCLLTHKAKEKKQILLHHLRTLWSEHTQKSNLFGSSKDPLILSIASFFPLSSLWRLCFDIFCNVTHSVVAPFICFEYLCLRYGTTNLDETWNAQAKTNRICY